MPERRDNGGNEIKEWKMCQGWTKKNSSNWQNPLTTKEDKRKKKNLYAYIHHVESFKRLPNASKRKVITKKDLD